MKTIVPLTCVGVLATVIGFQVFGINVPFFGTWRPGLIASFFQQAIYGAITIGALFLDAWILQKLAPQFGGSVSYDRAFSLAAHASIPAVTARLLGIFPKLLFASPLLVIFSIVVLFQGVGKMVSIPEEKRSTFFGVSVVAMLIAYIVLGALVFDLSPTPFNDIGSIGH
jgi:Yip1 domain